MVEQRQVRTLPAKPHVEPPILDHPHDIGDHIAPIAIPMATGDPGQHRPLDRVTAPEHQVAKGPPKLVRASILSFPCLLDAMHEHLEDSQGLNIDRWLALLV